MTQVKAGPQVRIERTDRMSVFIESADALTRVGIERALTSFDEISQVTNPAEADVAVIAVSTIQDATLQRMRVLRRQDGPRIVLVVDHIDEAGLMAVVEVGVSGILPREKVSASTLVGALRAAASGDGVLPPDLLGRLLQAVGQLSEQVLSPRGLSFTGLTDREVQVLRLVADGYDTGEIADRLCYSPRTIKNVIHDVMHRLNLRNRTHAVAYALRHGLI